MVIFSTPANVAFTKGSRAAMTNKNDPPKVIKTDFERWFTDAEIDYM